MQRVGWHHVARDCVQNIVLELSSRSAAEKATARASYGFDVSFISTMIEWIMHCAFAVVRGRVDLGALLKKILTQLNTLSAVLKESCFKLFTFVYRPFQAERPSKRN